MPRPMMWYVNALLFVMVGAAPIYFLVSPSAARIWSWGGTFLVLTGALSYIVFTIRRSVGRE